ncbi:alpha/beta-hydrolase [Cytidiella melzeri]|nr:alpha/beta-hydrolase [Cytidiella melzeri]
MSSSTPIPDLHSAPFTNGIVQLPSGLRLEAGLTSPRTPSSTSSKLVVCLHPWSWLGGRMHDPVLQYLKQTLLSRGYHVLRYNSRGVGKSSGWPSLTGKQEGEDLRELVHWAMQQIPAITSLVVLGYSYGSLIATLFPQQPDFANIKFSHILLSYPLGPRSWLTAFRSGHYTKALTDLLHNPQSNVLVVYGDHDNFTSVESYDMWADGLKHEVEGTNCGKLDVKKVERANHFWASDTARDNMLQCIQEWVP